MPAIEQLFSHKKKQQIKLRCGAKSSTLSMTEKGPSIPDTTDIACLQSKCLHVFYIAFFKDCIHTLPIAESMLKQYIVQRRGV